MFPPTVANTKSEKAEELPGVCYSLELRQTRISLVDRKHKLNQWQKNSTARTSDDHPNKCFHKGLVSTLQWNLNIEKMVEATTGRHHINVNVWEICDPDFHKKSPKFSYSYPSGK